MSSAAPPDATFRYLDTGIHGGRYNIALDQALIDLHRAGRSPNTLRLLMFTPSALASVPSAAPTSRSRATSQVADRADAVGKQVAGC